MTTESAHMYKATQEDAKRFLQAVMNNVGEQWPLQDFRKSSRGINECRYRNGTNKCFVGMCISDEAYDEDLEGNGVGQGVVLRALAKSMHADEDIFHIWLNDKPQHELIELLKDIQAAHDSCYHTEDILLWLQELCYRTEIEFPAPLAEKLKEYRND